MIAFLGFYGQYLANGLVRCGQGLQFEMHASGLLLQCVVLNHERETMWWAVSTHATVSGACLL